MKQGDEGFGDEHVLTLDLYGHALRLGAGIQWRITPGLALQPEVTYLHVYRPDYPADTLTFGIATLFGAPSPS